jgi:hypothetical protein
VHMKYIVYLIFITIPFASQTMAGHIYIIEISVSIGFCVLLFNLSKIEFRFTRLDLVVGAYALFGLVPVLVGSDFLYEASRGYRQMVLTPVLVYVLVRFSPCASQELKKALFLLLPGMVWLGLLLMKYYIIHGARAVGVEDAGSTITLSLLFCMGLYILIFVGANGRPTFIKRSLCYCLAAILGLMLFVTQTRSTTFVFLALTPFVNLIWERRYLRASLGHVMLLSMTLLFILITTGALVDEYKPTGEVVNEKLIQHSASRLFNAGLYRQDLERRLLLWRGQAKTALEHPIMGQGWQSYTVGMSGRTGFYLGSSHNIIVSTLTTSGLFGVMILLLMIKYTYKLLAGVSGGIEDALCMGKVLLGSFTIFLTVALTNDLTGGRVFLWFFLMSLVSKLSIETTQAVPS